MKNTSINIFIICVTIPLMQLNAQECRSIIGGTKAFPSSDGNLIWSSNRPVEYLYPGEKLNIVVTGQVNLMPEKKSEDRGGLWKSGPFSKRVEWVENRWKKPKDKRPQFANVTLLNSSDNKDGSYSCNIAIPVTAKGLTEGIILKAKVLNDNELSGSGGLSTGEYAFQLIIDNSDRIKLIKSEIIANLNSWGNNAVLNLNKLIEPDERLKCKYSNELAETIFLASKGLTNILKQQVLQYASSLAPQNHEIVIAIAQTYSGQPGGCEMQIKALSDQGITQIAVNSTDFKSISNSAKAFDILAEAYYECSDNFRDAKSVDSLRNFYRVASKQYGLVYDYPNQIKMAINYANAELDYNDKTEIKNAASFLEEIWQTTPRNIDSVGEKEREFFFGKFGNTQFKEFRDIKDSVCIKIKQKNNIDFAIFSDEVFITLKKEKNSSIQIYYQYVDRFRSSQNGYRENKYSIKCRLNRDLTLNSFDLDSSIQNNPNPGLNFEKIRIAKTSEIKERMPEVVSSLIRLIDLPTFCPLGTIEDNRMTHMVTHPLGNFQLYYYNPESVYSIQMSKSLPFIILEDSSVQFSFKKNTNQESKNNLIFNLNASPTLVDSPGIYWDVVEVAYF